MKQISSADRRALRARAHALNVVVIVGSAGLTTSVMAEIERCLKANELIKIRMLEHDRRQRTELLARICELTGASPVQHIGKILVVHRAKSESSTPEPSPGAKMQQRVSRRRQPDRDRRAEARREQPLSSARRYPPLHATKRRRP
ncbi:MAG: hypothetical protein A3G25_14430 [Betaproteobacteria bacterium RIFCSPLOWO2_12_FULL_63_13]|nr:MAG: hypothetical protein A3G25_14430 [Betaproteobacteria bacterium RIFCSPLOWO2_12_FULL_63_13]